MVDQLTLQTLSIALTGLTLSIAAIYYMLTLRYTRMNMKNTLETRQASLFMNLYETYRSPEFRRPYNEIMYEWDWRDYDDWWNKYGPEKNLESWTTFATISTFFEGMGVLVKRGLVDSNLVDDLISGPLIALWDKTEPIYLEYRKRTGHLEAVEWFEYLAREIKTIRHKQRGSLNK